MQTNQVGNQPIGQRVKDYVIKCLGLLKTRKFWYELFIMTLGMFVASLAVYFFLIPSKLIVGSITGLSLVMAKVFPVMSVGSYIAVINAILLMLSFILIGNEFGAKTVYTAMILGPMIDFLGVVVPMGDQSIFTTMVAGQPVTNPWFDLICFVGILSASQSILFSINASTGGLDILAKIFNKYLHISLGLSVTIAGGLICCTAFLINDVSLVIIGIIATWLNGVILNYFMHSMSSKIRAYIVTEEHEKIREFITTKIVRGLTIHKIEGGYTHKEMIQIETVLKPKEFDELRKFMIRENIQAFTTTDVVSQVYGMWRTKAIHI